MVRKPQLECDVRKRIDEKLDESGKLYQKGDRKGSLDLALEAWNMIPDPKFGWDYYAQSLSVSFVDDYVEFKNATAAKHWIEVMHEAYDNPERNSHYPLMVEASALYKLGLKSDAYDAIDRIFELFGRDGFKGENIEYLEFYLKERAKRDG